MKIFETRYTTDDAASLKEIILSGDIGFGKNVSVFEEAFRSFSKKKYNIATNSASSAAYMIFAYLKEKHGVCDVYTTTLGFVSPAWAARQLGHNIIFVDIEKDLLFSSRSYKTLRKSKNSKNKVVLMPVLYGGVGNISHWDPVGDEIVVVDSAHCATPTISADYLFFSFHPYKPICSSDGGMISTDSQEASLYFQRYRNFGRQPAENTYDIVQDGFKFYMNNLNASLALLSAKKYHKNLLIRKKNLDILSNNVKLALKLKLNGAYISAHNKDYRFNSYKFRKNFKLIGSAHNIIEVNIKKAQKIDEIFISPIFKYKNKSPLGIHRIKYFFEDNSYKKIIGNARLI